MERTEKEDLEKREDIIRLLEKDTIILPKMYK